MKIIITLSEYEVVALLRNDYMDKKLELEDSLAKLSFYLKLCLKDNDYDFCKKEYTELLNKVNVWIDVYAKYNSLNNIPKDDIKYAQDIFYSVPFTEYNGFYYFEYIDAFLEKINYFYNHKN